MASFTDDIEIVRNEFKFLKSLFDKYSQLSIANSIVNSEYGHERRL